MNLKEALDYRRTCPFCQRCMVLSVAGCPSLRVFSDKKGIRIQSKAPTGKLVSFNHDSSYGRTKRTHPIHNGPVRIIVHCTSCHCKPEANRLSRGYQFRSTIDNLKETGSAFTFTLFGDSFLGYDLQPQMDIIRCFDEGSFYHWTSDFVEETTILQRAKFSDSLENLATLHLPLAKFSNLRSKDDFLKKYKLYTLFS